MYAKNMKYSGLLIIQTRRDNENSLTYPNFELLKVDRENKITGRSIV